MKWDDIAIASLGGHFAKPMYLQLCMSVLTVLSLAFCLGLVSPQPAHASKRATKEEAIALVKLAVADYKANGKEKAFAAISEPKGKYRDRELFVVVLDNTGVVLAQRGLQGKAGAGLHSSGGFGGSGRHFSALLAASATKSSAI